MPGSGGKPYEMIRKGNVYSCSCSIWKHIDDIEQRRTCKHLRSIRGEKAETGRVGEEGIRKADEKWKEFHEAQEKARRQHQHQQPPHLQPSQQQQQQQQQARGMAVLHTSVAGNCPPLGKRGAECLEADPAGGMKRQMVP